MLLLVLPPQVVADDERELKNTWTVKGDSLSVDTEQPAGRELLEPEALRKVSPAPAPGLIVAAAAWKHSWKVRIDSPPAQVLPVGNWSQ